MKRSVLLALTVVLFSLSCKKDPPPPFTSSSVTVFTSSKISHKKEIKQKMFPDVKGKSLLSIVKQFKDFKRNNSPIMRSYSIDSLTVDSAIWVTEAALNYDFDQLEDSTHLRESDFFYLSKNINCDIATQKVSRIDLEYVYTFFTDSISANLANSERVKVIDVTAETTDPSNGVVTFKALVIKYFGSTVYYCTIDNTVPSGQYAESMLHCSGNSYQDARYWYKNLLSCRIGAPWTCAAFATSYSNVSTLIFSNSCNNPQYTNQLYHKSFPLSSCNSDWFSSTQLTAYVSQSKDLFDNNKPGISHKIVSFGIDVVWCTQGMMLNGIYWRTLPGVTYGVPNNTSCD